MSRTQEFTLPRIPDSSPRIVATVSALRSPGASSLEVVAKKQNEFKSFLGTRRQDVTSAVLGDSVMFDDVFCKHGRLEEQNAPKSSLPLTCRPYNSLHDKHVRQLYSRNPGMRKHLIDQGLITEEMRVRSTDQEINEKLRSHEMLERKELMKQQLEEREKQRLSRLHKEKVPGGQAQLPPILDWSLRQERKRQAVKLTCQAHKSQTKKRKAEEEAAKEHIQKALQHQKWMKHLEEEELERERKRQAEILRQQELRSAYYDRKFADLPRGQQLAEWHKVADVLHTRLTFMRHQVWLPQQLEEDESGQEEMEAGADRHFDPKQAKRGGLEDGSSHVLVKSEQPSQTSLTRREREEADRTGAGNGRRGKKAAQLQTTPTASKSSVHSKRSRGSPDDKEQASSKKSTPTKTTPNSKTKDVTDTGDAQPTREAERGQATEIDAGNEIALDLGPPPQPEDEFEANILNALQSADVDGSGYIGVDDVLTALQFHCAALEFHEGHIDALQQWSSDLAEMHAKTAHGPEGCLSYQHAFAAIADLLRQASADAVGELHDAGSLYMWAQLPDVATQQTLWLNRETGEVSYERPAEDPPTIRDEFFEETMVNMFRENDLNGDNLLDRNEFLKLLQSTGVGSRLTPEQVEELWMLFAQSPVSALDFNQFVPFARLLILMIYNNQYENEDEWIELSCTICQRFWYSKVSGQCILLPPNIVWTDPADDEDGGVAAGAAATAANPSSTVVSGGQAAAGRLLNRSGSTFGMMVNDQSTLRDRRILPPIPAPPAPSRQQSYGNTSPLTAITEETASVPSRPGSSTA